MNDSYQQSLTEYILSGHAFLHCPTTEKSRFIEELTTLAATLTDGGRHIFTRSHATGWQDADGHAAKGIPSAPPDPHKVPQEILDLPEETIFVLKDFGFYRRHRFDHAMQNRIKQEYAYQVIARQQRERGRSVSRQRRGG